MKIILKKIGKLLAGIKNFLCIDYTALDSRKIFEKNEKLRYLEYAGINCYEQMKNQGGA